MSRRGLARAREDAFAGAFAGPRVGVGALSVDREVLTVTEAAVAAEIHQALDVHLHFAAKVALHRVVSFEDLADPLDFAFRQRFGELGRSNPGLLANLSGRGLADAVEVPERDGDVLVAGEVDACDTSHDLFSWSSWPGLGFF